MVIPPLFPPTLMISSFSKDDHVILKLDIEGSEYSVLRALLNSGAMKLVDKLYGEVHEWAPNGVSKSKWRNLKATLARNDVRMLRWEADSLFYEDMESLNRPRGEASPGMPGELLDTCRAGIYCMEL